MPVPFGDDILVSDGPWLKNGVRCSSEPIRLPQRRGRGVIVNSWWSSRKQMILQAVDSPGSVGGPHVKAARSGTYKASGRRRRTNGGDQQAETRGRDGAPNPSREQARLIQYSTGSLPLAPGVEVCQDGWLTGRRVLGCCREFGPGTVKRAGRLSLSHLDFRRGARPSPFSNVIEIKARCWPRNLDAWFECLCLEYSMHCMYVRSGFAAC